MKYAQNKMSGMGRFDVFPEMDDKQFQQWAKFLELRTGTTLAPERKSFLVTNLGLRMREIDCSTYEEYYKLLSGVKGLQEWNVLVDRITVHETRFFRHPLSLEIVEEYVANKTADKDSSKVSIQVWSVACSTGEEAYSLAMTVDQVLKKRNVDSYFGITATDISPASLKTARNAVYSERDMRSVESYLTDEYFDAVGEKDQQVVGDYLRKRICFARKNVLDIGNEPIGRMDVIYCQNLLIYFDRESRMEIVGNMVKHLLPGGLLVLGSGELLKMEHPELEKISHTRVLAYSRVVATDKGQG